MISNAEIKRVKALQSKKFRDESGLFVVEGEKMVAEALESGLQVEAVYRRDEIGEQAMARISSLKPKVRWKNSVSRRESCGRPPVSV